MVNRDNRPLFRVEGRKRVGTSYISSIRLPTRQEANTHPTPESGILALHRRLDDAFAKTFARERPLHLQYRPSGLSTWLAPRFVVVREKLWRRGGGGLPVFWSSDKAGVLASGRLWRRATQRVVYEEFPEIDLRTPNISWGIIRMPGTLPSTSIYGVPSSSRCNGIYEPIHGGAPDISGKGVVNPVVQILSWATMLRYALLLTDEVSAIEKAVARVDDAKENGDFEIKTRDLGGTASTADVGNAMYIAVRGILIK
ncbi:Isocitrate/isopropylmalate dehydrogenase [Biscogniauxia sp. FL1348]|nr:Isocitrate/isopropylmalate dehydrogenase [Biscogniauxia sp. FL1348]